MTGILKVQNKSDKSCRPAAVSVAQEQMFSGWESLAERDPSLERTGN